MVELMGHNAINVFHDVNSILHKVTDIYLPKSRDFIKMLSMFFVVKTCLYSH